MQLLANPTLRLYIGAALISLSPVWVKLVDVSATASAFWRLAIGGVVIAAFLVVARKRLDLPVRIWFVLALAALFLAADLWFYHRSIQFIGPGLATLLANFQVFVLAAAGFVVLREPPSTRQLIAIPLALLGLALIVGVDWNELPADYRLGLIFGFGAAVTYAGYLLAMRRSRRDSTNRVPSREIAIVSLVGAAMLGITTMAEGGSLAISNTADIGWLVCYGVLSHGCGMLFITSSLPHVTTTQAGIGLLLQPTLSFVWDVMFFARPMSLAELAGAVIALLAIYLGSRARSEQAQGPR
ncbi:MAG: DMT family transporter [Gammaproteobacteria bacterium]|nr:DMT family transporter [Gammaproteobacteria bacterium]NNF48356.1 DMT family transporter [Woeseiaceae bacterium]MBT8094296.1 DMT family transporter [Gammaproteobacteria bacterium]MBT8105989.1 DMT family transporter [Gammaproteobacteria bacterium]NNK26003.1 DMT family transporter [Woeseiaceae bacterium]